MDSLCGVLVGVWVYVRLYAWKGDWTRQTGRITETWQRRRMYCVDTNRIQAVQRDPQSCCWLLRVLCSHIPLKKQACKRWPPNNLCAWKHNSGKGINMQFCLDLFCQTTKASSESQTGFLFAQDLYTETEKLAPCAEWLMGAGWDHRQKRVSSLNTNSMLSNISDYFTVQRFCLCACRPCSFLKGSGRPAT